MTHPPTPPRGSLRTRSRAISRGTSPPRAPTDTVGRATRRRRWRSRRSSTPRSGRACGAKKDRRRRSRSRSCRPSRRATRCCSRRDCRSRRRCCRRSRRRSSGPAFISACGATATTFSSGARRARCRHSASSSKWWPPGLIVVKHRSEPFGKFVNVAVLEGDQIKIVDEGVGRLIPDCPALVSSLTGAIDHRSASGVTAVLIQLAASMRQHGRGGALLVVPSGTRRAGANRSSTPVLYAIDPPYSELARAGARRRMPIPTI